MKKIVVMLLTIFFIAANAQASAFVRDEKVLKDSKPEQLSIADQIYLQPVTIEIGMTRIKVLVYRLTNKVAYVFHNNYQRYIRPRFIMPNVQSLYDENRGK